MANTPKLSIPEIGESQASKYVTHNEALRFLDALCQATIIDKDLTEPPGSPSDGDTYIVGATPSGASAWTGHDDDIAYYDGTSWDFHTPSEGWRVWILDEDEPYVFVGASAGWAREATVIGQFTGLTDTPNSFSGQGLKTLRVNDGETALEFADNAYDIGGSFEDKPGASQVLLRIPFVRAVDFPDDLSGSQGVVNVAPTAESVFIIKKNGTQFATMTFAGAATTAERVDCRGSGIARRDSIRRRVSVQGDKGISNANTSH
jgi:hypothetical protein